MDRLELSEAEFLAGPGRGEADLVIDDIFAKSFENVLDDWSMDTFGEPGRILEVQAATLKEQSDAYSYGDFTIVTVPEPAWGVAAIVGTAIVGLYVGADLVVRPSFQNQGIGKCLVIERFARFGGLPCWDHDDPAYSHAGLATHRTAYAELADRLKPVPEESLAP